MKCRGCGCEIVTAMRRHAHLVDDWVFCGKRCKETNIERLLRILLPVARHIASTHNSKAASLLSMALRSDIPVPLL